MKKKIVLAVGLFMAASLTAGKPCSAAFVVGGENGWQLSTDGIVDVFATYNSTSALPSGKRSLSLLSVGGNETSADQRFGVGIGLLPSVVAINVKAPTTEGVDSAVRVGIYPAIQNGADGNRFNTSPNIDFREFFYTAKGAYGELLAGRALNLYQGKNILNDMTLLTAGVVPGPAFRGNTTLGHIGYGYLYANFGPQIRYTTPDLAGTKIAILVGEPYKISADTGKTNSPRIEAEISYANTYGSTSLQAWASGLYQTAPRKESTIAAPVARGGESNQSIGGAAGVSAGFGGANLMVSGYGGQALGMVSAQDGDFLGSTSTDAAGKERIHWGFLAQATYALPMDFKVGVNYGQSNAIATANDSMGNIKTQQALASTLTYNVNKFTQVIAEYTWAQDKWHNGQKQDANIVALGTFFYW